METIIIIALFLTYIVFREIQSYQIIKDLTLKIKARDVFEYEAAKKSEEKPKEGKIAPEVLEPEEAPPEKYIEALKKEMGITEATKNE
jgi:hypothetical protein